jgi:hypothetical protein
LTTSACVLKLTGQESKAVVAVALIVDAPTDVAVPFEADSPTSELEVDSLPMPAARPPHPTAATPVTTIQAKRITQA